MFIIMAVSLYTSRIVLKTLGISDYGVYNVVGGIISMLSFLNMAMVSASQRFMSYELGCTDNNRLSLVFCTSINIHLSICLITFLIGESVGLWFVNTQLNIPDGRMGAANWVYQASIFSFMINVMSVPYNSAIVAHEKMAAFAFISVVDVVLKLLIVYLLLLVSFDRLITYSLLMVFVMSLIRLLYVVYCKRHFSECKYHFIIDKHIFKEMFSFVGWSLFGNVGFSFKDQISNIIINIFYGTSVNAARSIGIQVTSAVGSFAHSFTMALNPQITKQYAAGNLEASRKLVYAGSRYTFYLLTLISVPLIININYVLKLWLGVVPEYTNQFVVYSILLSLLYSLSECITKAIQATGRIKWFQIGVCSILLCELPIAWGLMLLKFPPYAVMWPSLFTYSIAVFFRFWLIQKYVEGYIFRDYLLNVVFRSIIVFCIGYYLCAWICDGAYKSIYEFIIYLFICLIIQGITILFGGMQHNERLLIWGKIKKTVFFKL